MPISAEKYIITEYEDSLKKYRDLYNVVETAKMEGIQKGKIETALKMLKKGVSIEDICDYTELLKEQVEQLEKR